MKRVLILFLVLLLGCSNAQGYEPNPIKKLEPAQFYPIVLSEDVLPSAGPVLTPEPTAKPTAKPKPKPKPTVAVKKEPLQRTRQSGTLVGKASWYCSSSIPICHYKYPPGSYVAAACGKLRRAMGANWRGKVVTVRANGRAVNVKLVDWCGSKDKTIDLYYAPMRKLGGTGVLTVKISW